MNEHRMPRTLTIMTPVPCNECGAIMPTGTVAYLRGWGDLCHYFTVNGCDAPEVEDDEDDWDWADDDLDDR